MKLAIVDTPLFHPLRVVLAVALAISFTCLARLLTRLLTCSRMLVRDVCDLTGREGMIISVFWVVVLDGCVLLPISIAIRIEYLSYFVGD